MFMNDSEWAVFYLREEGDRLKIILVNHQIHQTWTIIETVRAGLQDFTNVAAECNGISFWQNWQIESWKTLSLLESRTGSLLRTDVHVFSYAVLCMGITSSLQRSLCDKAP